MDLPSFSAGFVAGVTSVVVLWCLLFVVSPWLRAFFSGTPVPLMHVLGMRFRRTPPSTIIDAYVQLKKQGNAATLADVETAFIANRRKIHSSDDLVYEMRANAN